MAREDIQTAIGKFGDNDFIESSFCLLNTLGYVSDRKSSLSQQDYASFKKTYVSPERKINEEKALVEDWKKIDFLFQLTEEEIQNTNSLFGNTQEVDTAYESYLFFALELKEQQYTRTQLSHITREINKLVDMPAMFLFKHGETLTLSIINRRPNKKDNSKDVLEKVTLIKDIRISNPHRAHIEILFDLSLSELCQKYVINDFMDLHEAWQKTLDIKELNKQFYEKISNWYFWAKENVSFPADVIKDKEKRNSINLIRLITRIIFIWFIKEKGLVPDNLFDERHINILLKDYKPHGNTRTHHAYYRAILQNLFFGTLNQTMSSRKFASDKGYPASKTEHGVFNLYRYTDEFIISSQEAIALFQDIPFLNGGLFDCLYEMTPENKVLYIDGFTRNQAKQAQVPDFLFFAAEMEYDLNQAYGSTNTRYFVQGLFNILYQYKFTIEENTPIEEEVALDPELLGRVFENLLASYNPETQSTARKQTGSFYTHREIVEYMVDESLLAYLSQKCQEAGIGSLEDKIRELLKYKDNGEVELSEQEKKILIDAIDSCKILDPACGSGAFPMGILNKQVHLLKQLDNKNKYWEELQIKKVLMETEDAYRNGKTDERTEKLKDIENSFNESINDPDYARKLYLIENCIYGVDIQPIAIQISKLRCFISLIINQKPLPASPENNQKNRGIRQLPNLETKFVTANTLIGLEKPQQLVFRNPEIEKLETKLQTNRHKHFSATTRKQKKDIQIEYIDIQQKIASLLIKDGWNDVTAALIVAWDPYNMNWDPSDKDKEKSFFDPEWMFGIKDGFDIVIGNPPYARVQTLQQTQPDYIPYYRDNYISAKGSFDIYALFIEKGYNLLGEKGTFAYILPHKFFQAKFGESIRDLLTERKAIKQIVRFGAEQMFDDATTYTCLFFLSKQKQKEFKLFDISNKPEEQLSFIQSGMSENDNFKSNIIQAPKDKIWNFTVGKTDLVLKKIQKQSLTLGDITRKIFQGIATSADKIYVLEIIKQKSKTVICYSKSLDKEIEIENGLVKPFLMGKDVHRYQPLTPKNVVIFPYLINKDKAELMSQNHIKDKYPLGWEYILKNKKALSQREHGRFNSDSNWHCFSRPQNMTEFERKKIVTPDICNKSQMSLDYQGDIYHTTTIYSFVFNADVKDSLKYFIGILNSKILWFYLQKTGSILRGGFIRYKTDYLNPFPIPCSLSDNPPDKSSQDNIVTLVDKIMKFKQTNPETDTSDLEKQIDHIVYELYGLNSEEIRIVEEE